MATIASISPLLTKTRVVTSPAGKRFELARACVSLVKPRVVSLVVFTAVVACFAAGRGAPPLSALALLVVSGLLAAGGAAALNHYFDRDLDARMARTRERPLVKGQIPNPVLVPLGGVVMIVAGLALAATLSLILSLFEFVGAFVYVGIYTLWLKRRTSLNVVIGGVAGSAAVLGGWAAVDPRLGLVPWLLAGLVFAWTPAHFWSLAIARSSEYARAGLPMLPVTAGPVRAAWWAVAHAFVAVILSVWIGVAAGLGPIYFAAALAAGLGLLAAGLELLRRPDPSSGWQMFKWSGPYLGLVFLGLLLDTLF